MRYYAVNAANEDDPIVVAEFVDRDDYFDAGFGDHVQAFSADEMQNTAQLGIALSLWQRPDEHHRLWAVKEWRRIRSDPKFRIWVIDGASDLRDYALRAAPYADEDPTIELAVAAHAALSALAEAIEGPEYAEFATVGTSA
jgi:hypothetical protein